MRYVAIINIPGYLPMDDEPAVFDSAAEAWGYLADERKRDDNAWVPDDESDPDGPQHLDECTLALEAYERDSHGTGTVYGPTPGSDSEHDLGLAYSVDYAEEDESERVCILTGAEGEDPEDCTTHSHEESED